MYSTDTREYIEWKILKSIITLEDTDIRSLERNRIFKINKKTKAGIYILYYNIRPDQVSIVSHYQ